MHDLLLYGQIPASRHAQVMQIFAGLTALPTPTRILERRSIFRPNREPVRKAEHIGGSQTVTDAHKAARRMKAEEDEFRYCTLIEDLTCSPVPPPEHAGEEQQEEAGLDDTAAGVPDGSSRPRFTVVTADLPEPEVKAVMSSARTTTPVDGRDPVSVLVAQGQRFVHQYVVDGHLFVYNNIAIRLQRCMKLAAKPDGPALDPTTGIDAYELSPWDKTGGYMIEARVVVADGKNQTLVARGTEELRRLREELRGCVDLRTVERLAMDPRVR